MTITRKLKILYLVLEMDVGGLQRMVNQLIRMLDRQVFEPYICCLDRGGIFYDQTVSNCAGSFILRRKPGPFDMKLFARLYSIVKKNKINTIHSHNGCSSYAALTGRLAGAKRIIHTDHGRLVPDRKSAVIEDRLSSYLMDRYVGVSEELTQYLAATVRIPPNKLLTILNGVDTDTFKPLNIEDRYALRRELGIGAGDRIIGTVCRLDPIKNLEFMITCMPAVVKLVPDAKLVIVGDGSARKALEQLALALRLEKTVLFLGQRDRIERILPAFDIYCCTSLSEGTSMTILEAMACGLPIVASAVGGNLSLVDDTNGALFRLNDKDAFITIMSTIFSDAESRYERGRISRRKVITSFSLDRMVIQYQRLYLPII